jgi:hypothetical protein
MRDWCRRERESTAAILDFARGLRLVVSARRDGGGALVYLEMDYRSVPGFLKRLGFRTEDLNDLDPAAFCRRQRRLWNRFVVDAVIRLLEAPPQRTA